MVFRCGIDDCPYQSLSVSSFREHLRSNHQDMYPNTTCELPEFINSCFSLNSQDIHNATNPSFINSNQDIYSQELSADMLSSNDHIIENNCSKFIEILLSEALSKSVPFKHVKQLSGSLIKFFSSLVQEDNFTSDLQHQMLHLIHNQDIFNDYIESNFKAVFHEMVTISGSDDFFSYIPFEKSFFKIIPLFSSFEEIFSSNFLNSDILSSMPSDSSIGENLIHINIFIDDFQLCNPLMSKKNQKNSVTGIYYRIVSSNKFKFSGKNYVHLLGLCYSKTFKIHSDAIVKYIAKKINKYIDDPFNVTINNENRVCKLAIGYFSLDSKAASFLLGMKQSFNHNYCCRFCIEPRIKYNECFYERSQIRDQNQYINNISQIHCLEHSNDDIYGLQRLSPFRHFNCDNYFEMCPPCIGHDIF